jgi:hypothetical protein
MYKNIQLFEDTISINIIKKQLINDGITRFLDSNSQLTQAPNSFGSGEKHFETYRPGFKSF